MIKLREHTKSGFHWAKVRVPIYDLDLYVFFGSRDIPKFVTCATHAVPSSRISVSDLNEWERMAYGQTGMIDCDDKTGYGNVLYVFFTEEICSDPEMDTTIAHEAYHVSCFLTETVGIDCDNKDGGGEVMAYLIGFVAKILIDSVAQFCSIQNRK